MTYIKNLAACIMVLNFLLTNTTQAQQKDKRIINQVNNLIAKEKDYLPKIKKAIIADSSSKSSRFLKIYFNTKQTFKKGDLPADYVEMLPEILIPITQNKPRIHLLLLARESVTKKWKTLDYFGNQPARPIYTPPINRD